MYYRHCFVDELRINFVIVRTFALHVLFVTLYYYLAVVTYKYNSFFSLRVSNSHSPARYVTIIISRNCAARLETERINHGDKSKSPTKYIYL